MISIVDQIRKNLLGSRIGEVYLTKTASITARRIREDIGYDIDLGCNFELALSTVPSVFSNFVSELEEEHAPSLSRSLASSGVDSTVLRSHFSSVPDETLVAAGARCSDASEQTEVTLSGADGVGRVHDYLLGLSTRDGNNRSIFSAGCGFNQVPVQVTRTAQVVDGHMEEGINRNENVGQIEGKMESVVSLGQDAEVLLTNRRWSM